MSAPQFERVFLGCDRQHVDIPRSVFVERQRLEQDIVGAFGRLVDVNQLEQVATVLENVRVACLADFTLELLPIVRRDVLAVLLHMALRFYPFFEALKVDQSDRAAAFARQNQWVFFLFLP